MSRKSGFLCTSGMTCIEICPFFAQSGRQRLASLACLYALALPRRMCCLLERCWWFRSCLVIAVWVVFLITGEPWRLRSAVADAIFGHHPVRPECACLQATPVHPVRSRIGADQHAPEEALLMMVLFTSFAGSRQHRVRLRRGYPGFDGCRLRGSVKERPMVEPAARCLVRSRLVATEPQWPRMKSTVSRSLRTRHSRVIPKISLCALRLLRFRPSSLPCFAASDDSHFVPHERPTRRYRPVMPLAKS